MPRTRQQIIKMPSLTKNAIFSEKSRSIYLDTELQEKLYALETADARWVTLPATEELASHLERRVSAAFELNSDELANPTIRVCPPSKIRDHKSLVTLPAADYTAGCRIVVVLGSNEVMKLELHSALGSGCFNNRMNADEAVMIRFGMASTLEISFSDAKTVKYRLRENFRDRLMSKNLEKRLIVCLDYQITGNAALEKILSTLKISSQQITQVVSKMQPLLAQFAGGLTEPTATENVVDAEDQE